MTRARSLRAGVAQKGLFRARGAIKSQKPWTGIAPPSSKLLLVGNGPANQSDIQRAHKE
jgi:hypothetical protein